MTHDSRDYLERVKSIMEKTRDGEPTDDEILGTFALFDVSKRAEGLDAFDASLSGMSDGNVRNVARMYDMRRKMGNLHNLLKKAGR